jgi:hypothetical protein
MELRLSYLTSLEMIEHDLALKQIIHTTKQRLAIVENLMAYIKKTSHHARKSFYKH